MSKTALKATALADEFDEIARCVALAKAGNDAAFEELIDRTQAKLYKFCLSLTQNEAVAQDICQDTYVRVLEKIADLKDDRSFLKWLYVTARHLFYDHAKSPRNAAHTPIEVIQDIWSGLVDASDRSFTLEVQQALTQLSPDDRMVLLLVDLQGFSYGEAAAIMGVTEHAVRARLRRARQHFTESYNRG